MTVPHSRASMRLGELLTERVDDVLRRVDLPLRRRDPELLVGGHGGEGGGDGLATLPR